MRASDKERPNLPSILVIGVDARSRLTEGRRSFCLTARASRRTSAAESVESTRRRPSTCRRRTRPTPSGAHRGSSRGQDHIGAETAKLAEAILAGRPHPEQGYRSCLRPCVAESSIRPERARGHATSITRRPSPSIAVHRRTVTHAYSSSRLRGGHKERKKPRRTIEGFGGRPCVVEFLPVLRKGSGGRRPTCVPSWGERLQKQAVIGKAFSLRIYRVRWPIDPTSRHTRCKTPARQEKFEQPSLRARHRNRF